MTGFHLTGLGRSLVALLGCLAASAANGAITCNVSVTSMTVVYDPTVATQNVTTGGWTILPASRRLMRSTAASPGARPEPAQPRYAREARRAR